MKVSREGVVTDFHGYVTLDGIHVEKPGGAKKPEPAVVEATPKKKAAKPAARKPAAVKKPVAKKSKARK